jgi:uncharacterized protein involved in outer membrane biogenesis
MRKTLIIAAVVLVVVVVGFAVFLYNSIDPIVKSAIEKYGSEIAGTKVTVGSVDISLKSGRGTIRNVEVRNPEGFSSGSVFKLAEITVDIDVSSLNKDPVVIDEVRIVAPEVHVEVAANGRTNVGVLKDHVDRYSAGTSAGGEQASGYEKKFRITRFSFEDGHVDADANAVGAGDFEAPIPPVRLKDVGGPQGGSPDAIGKAVTRSLLGAAMSVVTREISNRAKGRLEDEAKKALESILK